MSSGKKKQQPVQQQAPQPTGGWQQFTPWVPAQTGYDAMGSQLQTQAGLGPQYIGPSAQTTAGWNMAEGALPGAQQVGQVGQGNYNFLSRAADVANNEYVQNMLKTNTNTAMDTLTRQMLPQLQSGAVSVGGLGSSRLGLAQGQAIGDTQRNLQNANNQLMMGAYSQGLGAQQGALNSMGGLQSALMAPALAMGQIGQSREGYEQARLDAPWKWMQNMGASQQYLNPLGIMQSGAGMHPGTQPLPQQYPYQQNPYQQNPYQPPTDWGGQSWYNPN